MSLVTADEINRFLVDEFPAGQHLCEEVGDGWAVAVMRATADHLRPGNIVNGPAVFGLCDGALYYACWTKIGIEPMILTSEMSIRYLRPARGDVVRARAELHHAGKRSLIGTIVVWTEDPLRPVAVAQGTYVRPTP
jgi:uncharacterized protein (TIGR00369 family)